MGFRRPSIRKRSHRPLKRLDEQLARVNEMYEVGALDRETYFAKRGRLNEEKQRLREQAAVHKDDTDLAWCRSQILEMLQIWDLAEGSQPAQLLAAIFERIEADTTPDRQIKLVVVPRPGWKSFFEGVVLERETGLEPATTYLEANGESAPYLHI